MIDRFDNLLEENGPAAIVLKQWLKPVDDGVIFPPTYANPSKGGPPVYNIDRHGDHSVCVVDSIPSQANRIEPAFGRMTDKGGNPVRLVPKVTITAKVDGEEKQIDLLDAGHRAADAVVQLSSLREEITAAIKARRQGDSVPLAKLAPTSLLFGMWDSRESGEKVPRLINSIIRACDVVELRRSSQFNAAIDFEAAGVVPGKGDKRLSEVGMDSAPAAFQLGGVEAKGGICRTATLNLCTLRDISGKPQKALHRYILGLALVAMTYFDGKTLNLRQGCQLVAAPGKPMTRVLVYADGAEEPFDIDRDAALAYAIEAAKEFGVGNDCIDAKFSPELARKALRKMRGEEGANL